jgi:four helix bundle protein
MSNYTNSNKQTKFDLEDRTLEFAKQIIRLCKLLPNNTVNFKLVDQIVRSAGSIGANYREANDCLGKKDFGHRLRISRKETKETIFWLELILEANSEFKDKIELLIDESTQIRNILSAIIKKVEP